MRRQRWQMSFAAAVCVLVSPCVSMTRAAPAYTPVNGDGQIEVMLKDHRFSPAEIHVPVNVRMQILVKNQDTTADEFDSSALKVEKVIGGGDEGVVRLHALDPGRYPFMGEFHSDTAQGVIIAE